MEAGIIPIPLQEEIQSESARKNDLVEQTKGYTLPRFTYYAVSVLTLGLPQTMKKFQHLWREWMKDPDLEADYGLVSAVNALVIAGQIATISYAYYSALENLLR